MARSNIYNEVSSLGPVGIMSIDTVWMHYGGAYCLVTCLPNEDGFTEIFSVKTTHRLMVLDTGLWKLVFRDGSDLIISPDKMIRQEDFDGALDFDNSLRALGVMSWMYNYNDRWEPVVLSDDDDYDYKLELDPADYGGDWYNSAESASCFESSFEHDFDDDFDDDGEDYYGDEDGPFVGLEEETEETTGNPVKTEFYLMNIMESWRTTHYHVFKPHPCTLRSMYKDVAGWHNHIVEDVVEVRPRLTITGSDDEVVPQAADELTKFVEYLEEDLDGDMMSPLDDRTISELISLVEVMSLQPARRKDVDEVSLYEYWADRAQAEFNLPDDDVAIGADWVGDFAMDFWIDTVSIDEIWAGCEDTFTQVEGDKVWRRGGGSWGEFSLHRPMHPADIYAPARKYYADGVGVLDPISISHTLGTEEAEYPELMNIYLAMGEDASRQQ